MTDTKHLQELLGEIAQNVAEAQKLLGPIVITDHLARPKPPPMDLTNVPAGNAWIEPTFGARIMRITDERTSGGRTSWRTSSGTDRIFNSRGDRFMLVNSGGGSRLFSFNREAFSVSEQDSMPLLEPTWSQNNPNWIYGGDPGVSPVVTLRDTTTGSLPVKLFDVLAQIAPIRKRSRTFLRGIAQAAGAVSFICGGTGQDSDDYCVYINDRAEATVIDLKNDPRLGIFAHFCTLDLSGRYVIIGSTQVDINAGKAIGYVWDTINDTFKPMNHSAGGHGAVGFGCSVNAPDDIDSQEYRFRNYADPDTASLIMPAPMSIEGDPSKFWPSQFNQSSHCSWNNAHPAPGVKLEPFGVATYRYGAGYDVTPATPWRPWDDEIIMVNFDGTVKRYAHHQSDVRQDLRPLTHIGYWATPRLKLDPQGRFALFTSNWGKTLGEDPRGAGDGSAWRQDVFMVELLP